MKRVFLSLYFLLVLCCSCCCANAETGPHIYLSGTATNIPSEVLQQLVRDCPNAQSIIITVWHGNIPSAESELVSVTPHFWASGYMIILK